MAITARAADMIFYELPHFKPDLVQIDICTTFRDPDGATQRQCILSTPATREAARQVEWDEWNATEIVEAFERPLPPGRVGPAAPHRAQRYRRTQREWPQGRSRPMTELRFLTAGESHGKALTTIVEGIPAGLSLTEEFIASDLRRRQGGYGRSKRQQIEEDRAEIMSGVRHGLTLGSPIALLVANRVWEDWSEVMQVEPYEGERNKVTRLRPGHADLAGAMKYGFDDARNVLERASARETRRPGGRGAPSVAAAWRSSASLSTPVP